MARNILFHSQIKKSTTATSKSLGRPAPRPARPSRTQGDDAPPGVPALFLGTGQWSKDIESKNWPEQLERSIP